MSIHATTRQALKAHFVRGSIPTEADFGELIDAALNQAEDGVFKRPNEPLSVVCQQPDQPVLRFFESADATEAAWQISLNDADQRGFSIKNQQEKSCLFLHQDSGNLGIGEANPAARLAIRDDRNGWEIASDPDSSLSHGGHLAIKSPSPQIDFIDIKGSSAELDWAIHVNQGRMWFLSSPWNDTGLILCPEGKVGIGTREPEQKLHVQGTAKFDAVIADTVTVGGQPVVVGDSLKGKITILDNGNIGIGEASPAARLTIRHDLDHTKTSKDPSSSLRHGGHLAIVSPAPQLDFIDTHPDSSDADWTIHVGEGRMWFLSAPWDCTGLILSPGGKVGIGTTTPEQKLHVNGAARFASVITDSLTVGGKPFVAGDSLKGKITILDNGNIGIGEANPAARLTIRHDLDHTKTSKDPSSSLSHGGHLAIVSPAPQLDFIDTHPDSTDADWTIHVGEGRMWFLSAPWDCTGLILSPKGKVGINTINPKSSFDVNGEICCNKLRIANKYYFNNNLGDEWLRMMQADSAGDDWGALGFAAGKMFVLQGSYHQSDLRSKDPASILPIANATDKIRGLNPVQYRYKTQSAETLPRLGFVAQELEQILPEAVGVGPDGLMGIQESCLVALLAQALKEQQAQIDALKAEIARVR